MDVGIRLQHSELRGHRTNLEGCVTSGGSMQGRGTNENRGSAGGAGVCLPHIPAWKCLPSIDFVKKATGVQREGSSVWG